MSAGVLRRPRSKVLLILDRTILAVSPFSFDEVDLATQLVSAVTSIQDRDLDSVATRGGATVMLLEEIPFLKVFLSKGCAVRRLVS